MRTAAWRGVPDLECFAAEHGLKIGTIADLIHYRIRNEKTIERVNECDAADALRRVPPLAYQDIVDNAVHLALVRGAICSPDQPTLVRVHVQNTLCDLFEASRGEMRLAAARRDAPDRR